MKVKSFLGLLLVFLSISLVGQEKWTVEKCIEYAIKHNIQIRQQSLNAQMTRNNFRQSKMAVLPSLNFNANHSWNFGHTVDPYTNDFIANNSQNDNFSLSSSITLFNGFQLLNSIRRSFYDWQAALSDRQKMINDISLNIATAYLQMLYDKENWQVADDQWQVNKEQLARSRLLYKAGSIAQGDVLTAEAQLANAEMQVVSAKNQLAMSRLNLIQMMNLDSANDFDIEYPNLAEISKASLLVSVDTVYQTAVQNLPEIKSKELKLKSSEIGFNIARGAQLPRIFLSGNYGTGYSDSRQKGTYVPVTQMIGYTASKEPVYATSMKYQPEDYPFNDQLNDNANKSLSLGMSIPLFNGYQARTQITNAKLSILNARLAIQDTRQQVYKQIEQAYADAVASYNKYLAAKKSLTAQKKAFEYMQKKFNVGMATTVDFNNAKSSLFKARSDMIRNKYEFVFKLKVLDFYQGRPITFN